MFKQNLFYLFISVDLGRDTVPNHGLLNTRPYMSHLKFKIKRPVFQKNSAKWGQAFVLCGSVKIAPWKIGPQKIATHENCPLRKYPPMKVPASENSPLWKSPLWKLPPRKLPPENYPKKIAPYESCHHSREKLKVVAMQWWLWVSWKYRYLFNLTWIVVFL